MKLTQLKSSFANKDIDDIRISVTSKCNLRCIYCHHEGFKDLNPKREPMSPDEISFIVDLAIPFGVEHVKITGGEPLVRNDVLDIIEKISQKERIKDLSIVTNGLLLEKYAKGLKKAGLKRINVSLDSLDPEMYNFLSKGQLQPVLRGITLISQLSFSLMKINMLVLRDFNDDSVFEMIDYIESLADMSTTPIHFQLIELVQTSLVDKNFFNDHFIDLRETFRPWLTEHAVKKYFRKKNMRECFILPSGLVIELVTPTHNSLFCKYCSRLRVTSEGYLKPCLMREDNLIDIIGPIRQGFSYDELLKIFSKAINLKTPYWTEKSR